jgi:hypothetical protein
MSQTSSPNQMSRFVKLFLSLDLANFNLSQLFLGSRSKTVQQKSNYCEKEPTLQELSWMSGRRCGGNDRPGRLQLGQPANAGSACPGNNACA